MWKIHTRIVSNQLLTFPKLWQRLRKHFTLLPAVLGFSLKTASAATFGPKGCERSLEFFDSWTKATGETDFTSWDKWGLELHIFPTQSHQAICSRSNDSKTHPEVQCQLVRPDKQVTNVKKCICTCVKSAAIASVHELIQPASCLRSSKLSHGRDVSKPATSYL